MNLASLFLIDKVDSWYHNWIKNEGKHEWEDFEKDLCERCRGNYEVETNRDGGRIPKRV